MLADIDLADGFTECALGDRYGALPTIANLGCARKGLGIELEVLLHDVIGEKCGAGRYQIEFEPGHPGIALGAKVTEQGRDRFKEGWLTDNESFKSFCRHLGVLGPEVE